MIPSNYQLAFMPCVAETVLQEEMQNGRDQRKVQALHNIIHNRLNLQITVTVTTYLFLNSLKTLQNCQTRVPMVEDWAWGLLTVTGCVIGLHAIHYQQKYLLEQAEIVRGL